MRFFFFTLSVLIFLLSCNKEKSIIYEPESQEKIQDVINSLQESLSVLQNIENKNILQKLDFTVDWKNSFHLEKQKLFIPISFSDSIYMKDDSGQSYFMNKRIHLQAEYKNGWQFTIHALFPNQYSSKNSFSGRMVFCNLKDEKLFFTNYYQGKPLLKNQDEQGQRYIEKMAGYVQVCHTVHAYVNGYYNSSKTYCNTYYIPGGSGMDNAPGEWQNFNPPGAEDQGGGTIYTEENIDLIDDFNEKIDDENLPDCMKKVLSDLKTLSGSTVADMLYALAGEIPEYNWKIKNGSLPQYTNGQTSSIYNKTIQEATTTFDKSKFTQATDLAIARTIYHEAIHAYLVIQYNIDRESFLDNYTNFVDDWNIKSNWNYVHHEEFARSLVNEIGTALKNYGIKKGYTLSDQFYNDLAWGGLESTSTFKNLSNSDKDRIREVIHIEQVGEDLNGNTKTQKGKKGGC